MSARTVAIIEDDPSMSKGLERFLNARGIAAEVYGSAEAFLAHSGDSRASCLLVDINLGGISGVELKRRLDAAGARQPVIFMTAVDSEQTKKEAMLVGCSGYLRKPFFGAQLIDAINRTAG